jgi:sugar phosphate permease
MFRRVDQSPRLARFLEWLSDFMSRRRGLPVVIGIAIVIVSFILQLIESFAPSLALHVLAVITLYVGVLAALIGLLLGEPLGK